MARQGLAMGSGGIGGIGSDGTLSGTRSDKCGAGVVTSSEVNLEVEGSIVG